MIVLDTNVVSEPLRKKPAAIVHAWLDDQPPGSLYLTAISQAELLHGVKRLPAGKRRRELESALTEMFSSLFDGRILAFDSKAAEKFAALLERAHKKGFVLSFADAAIAATVISNGMTLATRNTKDFRATGTPVINPWDGDTTL